MERKAKLNFCIELRGLAVHQKPVKFSAIYERENKSDFTSHNELTTLNNQLLYDSQTETMTKTE